MYRSILYTLRSLSLAPARLPQRVQVVGRGLPELVALGDEELLADLTVYFFCYFC